MKFLESVITSVGLLIVFGFVLLIKAALAADEPAPAPKQALVPFNSLEKLAVNGFFRQLDAARQEFCKDHGIPTAECGGITPDGVYRLLPTPVKSIEKP